MINYHSAALHQAVADLWSDEGEATLPEVRRHGNGSFGLGGNVLGTLPRIQPWFPVHKVPQVAVKIAVFRRRVLGTGRPFVLFNYPQNTARIVRDAFALASVANDDGFRGSDQLVDVG